MVNDVFIMGSRNECLNKIEAYCRAGVTLTILNFIPTKQDPQEMALQTVVIHANAPETAGRSTESSTEGTAFTPSSFRALSYSIRRHVLNCCRCSSDS